MSNDIQQALSDSVDNLTLGRSVSDVMDRGDRLRNRRRRRMTAGAVAATVVGATAASIALPVSNSPLPSAAATAWGPQLVSMPADDLDRAADTCYQELTNPEVGEAMWRGLPENVNPVAAHARDGSAILVFKHNGKGSICEVRADGDLYRAAGLTFGEWRELRADEHVRLGTVSSSQQALEAPVSDVSGALQVSDDVERVEIKIGDVQRDATVEDGLAMFWMPGEYPEQAVDSGTVTAYDSDGGVLATAQL